VTNETENMIERGIHDGEVCTKSTWLLRVSRKDRITIQEKEREQQKLKDLEHEAKRLASERRQQTLKVLVSSAVSFLVMSLVIHAIVTAGCMIHTCIVFRVQLMYGWSGDYELHWVANSM